MSRANGGGPSTDLLGSLGLPYADEPAQPDEAAMNARVRAVVERQRPPAPVIVRRLDEQPTEPPDLAEPEATAARESSKVGQRRIGIFEWLQDEGPQTLVEIGEHFALDKQTVRRDVDALRGAGKVERTGEQRCIPGRGGRPSPEFRAIEPDFADREPTTPPELLGAAGEVIEKNGEPKTIAETIAERRELGLTIDPTPFADRPGASEETRRIDAEVRRELEAASATAPNDLVEGANAGRTQTRSVASRVMPAVPRVGPDGWGSGPSTSTPVTVHEQLVVRYVGALIGWVERTAFVRDDGPPEHVYDRIERLLQIRDGVA